MDKNYKRWTPEEKKAIIKRIKKGINYQQIYKEFKRSERAISNKIDRKYIEMIKAPDTTVRCDCGHCYIIDYDPIKEQMRWINQSCPKCNKLNIN